MKKLYLVLLLAIFNSFGLFAVRGNFDQQGIPVDFDRVKYPELAKFVDRYCCPEELQAKARDHFDKGGEIDRIINAERLRVVIKEHNLDCLAVAEKYLYLGADGTYRVLSKKVDFHESMFDSKSFTFDPRSLTVKEFQQLIKIIQITGLSDLHPNNICRNSVTGKITFIDTENVTFGAVRGFGPTMGRRFSFSDGVFNVILNMMCVDSLSDAMRDNLVPDWVAGVVRESLALSSEEVVLFKNSKYDKKLGLDFQRVYLEYRYLTYHKLIVKKYNPSKKLLMRLNDIRQKQYDDGVSPNDWWFRISDNLPFKFFKFIEGEFKFYADSNEIGWLFCIIRNNPERKKFLVESFLRETQHVIKEKHLKILQDEGVRTSRIDMDAISKMNDENKKIHGIVEDDGSLRSRL